MWCLFLRMKYWEAMRQFQWSSCFRIYDGIYDGWIRCSSCRKTGTDALFWGFLLYKLYLLLNPHLTRGELPPPSPPPIRAPLEIVLTELKPLRAFSPPRAFVFIRQDRNRSSLSYWRLITDRTATRDDCLPFKVTSSHAGSVRFVCVCVCVCVSNISCVVCPDKAM